MLKVIRPAGHCIGNTMPCWSINGMHGKTKEIGKRLIAKEGGNAEQRCHDDAALHQICDTINSDGV